ncbi:MAG: glycosyltransferase family 4 protein [Chloroflexi bacterium]|nr:glycosyltransferase family 4 protein [Chloroflexota bacterium]
MKLLLIADGRSPITRRWIAMLEPLDVEITLVSSYPCEKVAGVKAMLILPLAFARQSGSQAGSMSINNGSGLIARFRPLAQLLRHQFGPWNLLSKVGEYRKILQDVKPDLVHALRIPFEGMIASFTPLEIPVILSSWGNDFTLHAKSTPQMASMTRRTLQRGNAFLSDVQRDIRLAHEWGFDPKKPSLVVPGNGGLDLAELDHITSGIQRSTPPQIINPRGLRSYVLHDTFFKSIPMVLAEFPDVKFVCASMAGQAEALYWTQKLGIAAYITLLPFVSQQELWVEFAKSQISVSISSHDGTPNSLLESMALGCLPICGNIESIREWITHGENGLLVDPKNPAELAAQIISALKDVEFQKRCAQKNRLLVQERADLESSRNKVADFYARL